MYYCVEAVVVAGYVLLCGGGCCGWLCIIVWRRLWLVMYYCVEAVVVAGYVLLYGGGCGWLCIIVWRRLLWLVMYYCVEAVVVAGYVLLCGGCCGCKEASSSLYKSSDRGHQHVVIWSLDVTSMPCGRLPKTFRGSKCIVSFSRQDI